MQEFHVHGTLLRVMSGARPLFFRNRKSTRDLTMSQECAEVTYAVEPTSMQLMTLRVRGW